jgi:5'-methylthioinosine phosphorylase
MLAIIGGSSLDTLAALEGARRIEIDTPYGAPSGPLIYGRLQQREVIFLARHGEKHQLPPHRINYRANLWALRAQAVTHIVAVATVGGIGSEFGTGVVAVPDQIIDYTWGRASTFFDGENGPMASAGGVKHIDFTRPYDESLRARLLRAARRLGAPLHDGGTYAATQGPRLETAAEIGKLARDGAHLVGMTGMPEAALARELALPYAALAVVVNAAAGTGASGQAIDLLAAEAVARTAMTRVVRILIEVAADGD